MARRRGFRDYRDPDYEAYEEALAADRADQRADGDPVTDRDWDRLEAGPMWHYPPGNEPKE